MIRRHRFDPQRRKSSIIPAPAETAMAFDGVPIGISDGLPEPRRFCLGRCRVSGSPGLENALGAVEMLLVPLTRSTLSHTRAPQVFSRWPHSLSMPPFCQIFPEARTPVSLPSRQSVF